MKHPALILALRAAALLLALGFLAAYVLYASGRLTRRPAESSAEKGPEATAPSRLEATVLSSSKTISQPVFSPHDPGFLAPPTIPKPGSAGAPGVYLGGSKSGLIRIDKPSPTPASP